MPMQGREGYTLEEARRARVWLIEKIRADQDDAAVIREAGQRYPGLWNHEEIRTGIAYARETFAGHAAAQAAAKNAEPKFCGHCGQKLPGVV